jgi:mRNA interferase RelE/StbE
MKRIIVHRRAANYLKNLPQPLKIRVKEALRELSDAPLDYPGVIQMSGDWAGYCRIRVGHLRIIFEIDEMDEVIYVDHIGARGDIYKN